MEPTDAEYGLVKRHLIEPVLDYLNDFRVVVINGPRQAGKTTLLHELHARLDGTFASLDQPGDLAAAREDPIGFVESAVRRRPDGRSDQPALGRSPAAACLAPPHAVRAGQIARRAEK